MSSKVPISNSLIRLPVNDEADCVLILEKKQTVHLFGCVSVRKLAGFLSIHGHDLADREWHSVCSSGPHLVTFECNCVSCGWQRICLSTLLDEIDSDENKLAIKKYMCTKRVKDIGCVLMLKSSWLTQKLQCQDSFELSTVLDIFTLESCQKELYEKTSDLSFTVFSDVPPPLSPLIMSTDWTNIPSLLRSRAINKDCFAPIVFICGGKGVGKSTFGRYLINKLLNTEPSVYFLETDVGQSEFTPPGVLSLNKIDSPVYGPPFSHLSRPEKAYFFGDVSPKDRPNSYIRFIHILYQYYNEHHREVPLIVNTHGWIKGMGVRILLDIIRIVQPTHVIQINCESQSTNNLPELNKDFLQNETGWSYHLDIERDAVEIDLRCSPHIHQMDAFASNTEGIKGICLQPSELRSLSLLSYFGSSQSTSSVIPVQEYILHQCVVFSTPISNLSFYSVGEDIPPSQMLYSMNGSVVGLVKIDDMASGRTARESRLVDEIALGEYLGLGIIRNIDPENNILFLITPEPLHILHQVNTLVKGKLEVPDILLKKQDSDNVPYSTSEFTYNHKGSGQKRIRYNLVRQKTRERHPTVAADP